MILTLKTLSSRSMCAPGSSEPSFVSLSFQEASPKWGVTLETDSRAGYDCLNIRSRSRKLLDARAPPPPRQNQQSGMFRRHDRRAEELES